MSRVLRSFVVVALLSTGVARAEPLAVPLVVADRADLARRAAPASASVPMPKGLLKDPGTLALTAGERSVPLQTTVLQRWPDGTVRWLLLDFLADVPAGGHTTYTLRTQARPAAATHVHLDAHTADAGPIKVAADDGGALAITLRDGRRVGPIPLPAVAVGGADAAPPIPDRVSVETDGPVRTELLITAHDRAGLATELRVAVFAGQPLVRLLYTLTSLSDRPVLPIRSVPVTIPGRFQTGALGVGGGERTFAALDRPHELVAEDPGFSRVDGANTARGDGWARVAGDGATITVVAPYFWEEYPKALRVAPDALTLDLFAGRTAPVAFGSGAAKTHEVWLGVEPSASAMPARDLAAAVGAPLVAIPPASWIVASGAMPQALAPSAPAAREFLGRLAAAFARYRESVRTERWDDVPFDGCRPDVPPHVRVGLYGLLDWGDWQFPGLRSKTHGCEAWGNLEYDLPQVLALGWAATGSPEFYDGLVAAARHYRDVDIMHHVPREHPDWLGMNHPHKSRHFSFETAEKVDLGHTWTEGLVSYWRLTGDVRALQAARGIADALVRRNVPGGANPRQYGWPMIALVGVWDATGDARYRDAAADYAHAAVASTPPTPASGDWKMGILADGIAATYAATRDERLRHWLLDYADALSAEPGRYKDPRYALPLGYLATLTGDTRYAARAIAAADSLKLGAWGKPLAVQGRTGFRLLAPLRADMAPPTSPRSPTSPDDVRPGRDAPRPASPPGRHAPSPSRSAPARHPAR